ncbi:MAG: serine O-acetyltransferase [Leptospiraceae bacterium]|nr:serine O-acetyltransferase [Leptospiraceae bacterium]MCK6381775.1 serine O-acetyltransferase [Leptospiraceae bacterium]NUM40617.1 serine O-acetyltransferase [Leptospiraceae bacterium]
MFENIKKIRQNDPAAKSYFEVVLCYPGLHAIWFHYISHFFYKIGFYLIARIFNSISRFVTGIDIHPGATLHKGIMIDHGMGVVIGETSEIGEGCLIYQGVTLGGTGKEKGKRHPTLNRNVVVGAGAKILGNITIGDNVRIGAGSVVMRDVPPDSTVVGIPGRVVKDSSFSRDQMLDHNLMPDPVAKVFAILNEKVDNLEKAMNKIGKSDSSTKLQEQDEKYVQDFIHGDGI